MLENEKIYDYKKISIKICLIYLSIGLLWIVMSDLAVVTTVKDKDLMTSINIIKGWGYVFVSGILIYLLTYLTLKKISDKETELRQSYQELLAANEEIEATYGQLAASEGLLKQQYQEMVIHQQKLMESEKRYKLISEALHHLAYHDQLTGLKNRNAFTTALTKLMEQEHSKKIGLLFVDIDNFKYINDSMGHTFGDQVLKEIGKRLTKFQNEHISIYRLGGDEYIVLLESFGEITEVEKLAVNVLRALNQPLEISSSSIFITASIGISLFPEHGENIDELLKNADIAVFRAKEAGKNKIIIFNQPMNEAVTERAQIEKHLRTALEKNEFELYYQPQLDVNTNHISGFEALLRWKNPELGFVPPNKFISVAEDTHLIIPIGEWVLRNSCMFLKHLHNQGYRDLTMSVNISMLQLLQDDFVDMVTDILELVKIHPKYLELEITESVFMESYETIAGKLKLLKAIGVKIALDDFGKGYSSLHYLKHLPISTLKIDKTFIDNISLDKVNKSLTHLIVKIGRVMDLCVVAEGVETEEQMEYLKKHKCNKIQGYLFCRPLPHNEILKKLEISQQDMQLS